VVDVLLGEGAGGVFEHDAVEDVLERSTGEFWESVF